MTSFLLRPEVAGGLGPETEMDNRSHPPVIKRLHYVFSGWAGSDIVESFPSFIVTTRLAEALRESNLSGFELDDVTTSKDEQFQRFFPEQAAGLPAWMWLRPTGREGQDDFWQDATAQLHVSERVMRLLERFDLAGCEVLEDP